MTTEPITPPVPADVLADAEAVIKNGANVKADVPIVQRIVKADKSAIVAGVIHILILVVAAFKLHMSAKDVAVMGSIVTAGLSWFLTLNLSGK